MAINSVCGQDLAETLALASSNLKSGQLSEAEIMYRRVAYFDTTNIYEEQTIEGLAHISYMQGRFDEASGYFLSLSRISANRLHYYYHVLSLMKGERWMLAKAALLSSTDSSPNVLISKEIMLGLIEFGLRDFERSEQHFGEAKKLLATDIDDEKIFINVKKVNRKNRTKAIILSGLLPGLGQAYSGHYKEGVNSFFLISAIGLVYYYTLTNVGILDAIISVLPWVHRYYVGGMNTAAELVDDFKDDKLLVHYNDLVILYGGFID